MKFIALIYTDQALLESLPPGRYDAMMRDCFAHTDALTREGHFVEAQQLEGPETAKSIRIRNGRMSTTDGPFAEAKEVLGGFNLIEARDMEEALRIASKFPWAQVGCVEVRPVRELESVRLQAEAGAAAAE